MSQQVDINLPNELNNELNLTNSGKKKILLLSDDLRMHSGIGTMSRFFVMGTLHKYDWVQIEELSNTLIMVRLWICPNQ